MNTTEEWVFVVDTNQYAGSFERPLTAYCTGVLGDCGVGESEAKEFRENYGLDEYEDSLFTDSLGSRAYVVQRADEHGCHRPTSIYHNLNYVYNSVAIFFSGEPTKEQIDLLKIRAMEYTKGKEIKIKSFRLVKEVTTRSEETKIV